MSTVEEVLNLTSLPANEDPEWGRPFVYSSLLHAIALSLFISLWVYRITQAPEPIKVLEISMMGPEDLALKGTGTDFGRGPLPDKSVMAPLPKRGGRMVNGNTPRVSRSLSAASGPGAGAAPPAPLPRLIAKGPLFGSASGSGAGAAPGVGREKLYLKTSASRLAKGAQAAPAGGGEGLVGVSKGPIDLKAHRGAGGEADGNGSFLGGGDGSVNGGNTLMRRGESIVVHYPSASEDLAADSTQKMELPKPSDDFFSIRGALSHRKILKMKLPRYPRWAEERGIETQISVWLSVTANGKVKTNLYVEQTSGYPEIDQLTIEAVSKILFVPLPDALSAREESGVATFNFKLKSGATRNGHS
jgi:TonB family protein